MHNETVCILAAGRGTRMGDLQALNKALLPINKKAIISHIIEKFSPDTQFIIALGDKGEQVRTYLEMAHPSHRFEFITVENFSGPGSGPGHSLLCCKQHLMRPFYFVACDTLWLNDKPFSNDFDWFAVSDVPAEESGNYCNFKIDPAGRITDIHDKQQVSGSQFKAFVGLCFVRSFDLFWSGLSSSDLIQGEHQISNGIKALVDGPGSLAVPVDWIDTGDSIKYAKAVRHFENFDFSKSNEALYIVGERVIKFFADTTIADRRVERALQNPSVFPKVSSAKFGFYNYEHVPGQTLYQHCTPILFAELLDWLHNTLWIAKDQAPQLVTTKCQEFYQRKTDERIKSYFRKYDLEDQAGYVNELFVPGVAELLSSVPWEKLWDADAVFFHGDLQFDNIIYSADTRGFTLLDWRQDFAGEVSFGDRYYDLAKLLGGLVLNYDYIKQNLFEYQEVKGQVLLDYARRVRCAEYEALLNEYVESNGLDWHKVKLMVPIIFLNMAPLHHAPFDKFLFALGRRMLYEELNAPR